jgi:hypothetical protein
VAAGAVGCVAAGAGLSAAGGADSGAPVDLHAVEELSGGGGRVRDKGNASEGGAREKEDVLSLSKAPLPGPTCHRAISQSFLVEALSAGSITRPAAAPRGRSCFRVVPTADGRATNHGDGDDAAAADDDGDDDGVVATPRPAPDRAPGPEGDGLCRVAARGEEGGSPEPAEADAREGRSGSGRAVGGDDPNLPPPPAGGGSPAASAAARAAARAAATSALTFSAHSAAAVASARSAAAASSPTDGGSCMRLVVVAVVVALWWCKPCVPKVLSEMRRCTSAGNV